MSNTSYIIHEPCALNNSNIVIDCHLSNDCGLSNEAYLNFEMDLIFEKNFTNDLKYDTEQAILQSVSTVQVSINGHMFTLYEDILRNLKKFKNYEFSNFKVEKNLDLRINYYDDDPKKIRLIWSEPIYHPMFLFNNEFKRDHIGPIESYVSISLRPRPELLLNSFSNFFSKPVDFKILKASMLTKTLTYPVIKRNDITLTPTQLIPTDMIVPQYNSYKNSIGNLINDKTIKSKSLNLTLFAIPNKLYVFALPKNPDIYSNFTSIEKLKLRINNEICIFKNTTPLILYNMSKKNGYDGDFFTWKNNSICCFDFCKDLNYHNDNSKYDRIDISAEITHKEHVCSDSNQAEYELYFIVEYTGSYYKDFNNKNQYDFCVRNHPCSLID